MKNQRVRI